MRGIEYGVAGITVAPELLKFVELRLKGCPDVRDISPLRDMARRGRLIWVDDRLKAELEKMRK